jgi:hypothetical protein
MENALLTDLFYTKKRDKNDDEPLTEKTDNALTTEAKTMNALSKAAGITF